MSAEFDKLCGEMGGRLMGTVSRLLLRDLVVFQDSNGSTEDVTDDVVKELFDIAVGLLDADAGAAGFKAGHITKESNNGGA